MARERPILFSTEMTRKLLAGKKTMTRRVCKQVHTNDRGWVLIPSSDNVMRCPYGEVGDRLFVREAFLYRENKQAVAYRADFTDFDAAGIGGMYGGWKPSIHLPRKFSRINLEITANPIERLKDMRSADVVAEGFPFASDLDQFRVTWNDLNASRGYSWDSNPYVWVLSFRVL